MSDESLRQKELYEAIHDAYEDHYYDAGSMVYRERYYYDPMFRGLDLNGLGLIDLASGSGHNSLAVLQRFPRARVTGLDISTAACAAYRRNVNREALEGDLTKPLHLKAPYDVAMILGGLHHCVVDLPMTLDNIARMLKPGGLFLMLEPNREFFLEGLRRVWYRTDRRYFDAATESALAHDELLAVTQGDFASEDVHYLGGPAYFLIAQSMLFRLPKGIKSAVRNPLMRLEALYNRLPGRAAYPFFVARWRRAPHG